MKELIKEFYVRSYSYISAFGDINVNFVPSIMKRRLSKLDKCALTVLNKVFSDDVQFIVFASQYGEEERLEKIISQYTDGEEVSPNTFSGSVHNYLAGFYLLNKRKSIPYTALSSGNKTFSTSLLSSVVSKYNNVIFCYADVHKDDCLALALNISKEKTVDSKKYIMYFKNNDVSDDFFSHIELFEGKIKFVETSLYKLERIDYEN